MEMHNVFEVEFAHLKETLEPKDYEAFISFKKREQEMDEYKATLRREKRKKAAGQNFFVRRQSLVLRRVDQEEIAPDDDVLAYEDIYKLKKARHEVNGTYEEKMKIPVSDEEIKAFRDLEDEGHFYQDITLEMIESKISPAKGTGGNMAKKDGPKVEVVDSEGGKVIELTGYSVEDVPPDEAIETENTPDTAEEKTPEEPSTPEDSPEEQKPEEDKTPEGVNQ